MGLKDYTPIALPVSRPVDFDRTDMGVYKIETTQRHAFGRRAISDWGEIYRYFHSLGDCLSGFLAANIAPMNIGAVIPVAAAVGDRQVTVTIASGDGYNGDGVIAADELVGARFVAGHGEALVQNRRILGNPAVASGGGTCKITLSGPIANALTAASSYVEIMLNQFRYCSRGAYEYHGFVGVPTVNCPNGYNGWVQTAGPCWICPGGGDATPGDTANDRMAYGVGDGSVNFGYALTIETGYQYVGYCLDATASGTGAMPMVMLQLE